MALIQNSTFYMAQHQNMVYCLEYSPHGKLKASTMPAGQAVADWRVALNKVPLKIRRAARATLKRPTAR